MSTVVVQTRLEPLLREELGRRATENERSIRAEIRVAVRHHLAARGRAHSAADERVVYSDDSYEGGSR